MLYKSLPFILIFSIWSCGPHDNNVEEKLQNFETYSSNVIETDVSDTVIEEDPYISVVWFIESNSGDEVLVKRPCQGLTQLDDDSFKSCAIPVGMQERKKDLSKVLADINKFAKSNNISNETVDSFIQALKEDHFVHKLRKVNIFGQANSLKQFYPSEYEQLVSFLFKQFV